MKKPLVIVSVVLIAMLPSPLHLSLVPETTIVLAQTAPGFDGNSPPAPPAGPKPTGPQSFSDVISTLDSGVTAVNDFFESTVGQVTGVIDNVFGLFNQFTAPLQSLFQDAEALSRLITKVISFPSTVSGWWDGLVSSVTGQYEACRRAVDDAVLFPFKFESGWCFGNRTVHQTGTGTALDEPIFDLPLGGNASGSVASSTAPQSFGEIFAQTQGPAGLPIPSLLRARADQVVDATGSDGDRFDINPTVVKHYTGNRLERAYSRLQAENTLGKVGQAKMKEELDGITEAVASNFGTAKAAQGLGVTQDVMKQMVQMQAQTSLLLGALASGGQEQRINGAIDHLNLSNISRSLDQQNRGRRIDRTLDAYKVLRSASMTTLF